MPTAPERAGPAAGAGWLLVILLTAGNALAHFHRILITLFVEPIKAEFDLSDTALGLLIGLSFTVSYALAVLPLARLSDHGLRCKMVGTCVLVWSAIFASCLIARSYAALVVTRIGVGVSQAGYGPASISLISEHFLPKSLASATGLFASGVYLGGGLAMLVGGGLATYLDPAATYTFLAIGEVSGWNLILFLCGVPGIALGMAMLGLIRNPRQTGDVANMPDAAIDPAKVAADWFTPAHSGIVAGLVLMIFVGNATGVWIPSFFQRAHGWQTAQIGQLYGVTIITCGVLGSIGGGWFASRLRHGGHVNAHLTILLSCFAVLIPLSAGFPLVPDPGLALALIGLMNVIAAMTIGVGYALLQEITPRSKRARIAGITSLFASLAGAGLGPLSVATMTDHVFGNANALPQAISATALVGSIAACILLSTGIRHLWVRDGTCLKGPVKGNAPD